MVAALANEQSLTVLLLEQTKKTWNFRLVFAVFTYLFFDDA